MIKMWDVAGGMCKLEMAEELQGVRNVRQREQVGEERVRFEFDSSKVSRLRSRGDWLRLGRWLGSGR